MSFTFRRLGWFRSLALLLAPAVAGCSGGGDAPASKTVYPVKGQVLLPNGKPLDSGRVVFVPRDGVESAAGELGPDGTFSLRSGDSGDGAPVGEYKVRIELDPSRLPVARRGEPASPPFPSKYLDEDASELTASVKPGPNELPPFRLSGVIRKASVRSPRD